MLIIRIYKNIGSDNTTHNGAAGAVREGGEGAVTVAGKLRNSKKKTVEYTLRRNIKFRRNNFFFF